MTCAICLSDLASAPAVPLVTLGCSHVFHKPCIQPWFERAGTCPTCRTNMGTPQELTSIFVQTIGDVSIETADSSCRSISQSCQAKIVGIIVLSLLIGGWIFITIKLLVR